MQKHYSIKNKNFTLKSDLTLDEAEEVQQLFQNLFIQEEQAADITSGQTGLITGSFSNSEIKRFLSIALEPECIPGKSREDINDEFDFGKIKESTAVEVIKDFFLLRIKKFQDFTLNYAGSMRQQL